MLIFGSGDVQLKAKDMIEDMVQGGSFRGPGRADGEMLQRCHFRSYSLLIIPLLSSGNSNTYRGDSCWSSSAVQAAAAAAPACTPIDWIALRENRDKYEAMKWQGDSSRTDLNVTGRHYA